MFNAFIKLIEKWRNQTTLNASELAETILDESGYTEMWQNDKSVEAESRLDNLKELVNAISEFDTIRSFIEHIQLVMDNELNNKNNSVNILTFHASKGLEFENIFLPGWEEEVFPNKRALEERLNEGLEEERRLAYVGITRAQKRVWILHANSRIIHGQWFYSIPSRFLRELPPDNIITNGDTTQVISPMLMGFNDESTVVDTVYAKVRNETGSAATITVTLTFIPLEA